MKKIVRLTESELYDLVEQVLKEEREKRNKHFFAKKIIESVIQKLNEWDEDEDWEDDEEEEDDEPTVNSLTDAAEKLSAEKVFDEFAQYISRDQEEELIGDIVSEGGPRERYLSDYLEYCNPLSLLRQADNYFGTWITGKWAQDILHTLWWN